MSLDINRGSKLPLSLLLEDGLGNQFPAAHVFNQDMVEVTGSPFSLTHVAYGYYTNNSYTTGTEIRLIAIYIVYTDIGHTEESTEYSARSEEIFQVSDSLANPLGLIGVIEADGTAELLGVIDKP